MVFDIRVSQVPSLRAKPKFSLRGAKASNDLLASIEEGHVEDVRRLVFQLPEGITPALNTPSLLVRHKLRTPLMAAAASGDFAKLTTILNAFNRQYDNKVSDMSIPSNLNAFACMFYTTRLVSEIQLKYQLPHRVCRVPAVSVGTYSKPNGYTRPQIDRILKMKYRPLLYSTGVISIIATLR